jgi:hypothetical protein
MLHSEQNKEIILNFAKCCTVKQNKEIILNFAKCCTVKQNKEIISNFAKCCTVKHRAPHNGIPEKIKLGLKNFENLKKAQKLGWNFGGGAMFSKHCRLFVETSAIYLHRTTLSTICAAVEDYLWGDGGVGG